MKSSPLGLAKKLFGNMFAALLGLLSISSAQAQIFVTNWGTGTIGEYNTDGTTVNATLVSGLYEPEGIAISGNGLFVATGAGTIDEYTLGATPGTVTSPTPLSLVSGLSGPLGLAISGNNLFVASVGDGHAGTGTVGEYTLGATPGTVTYSAPSLISDLYQPIGLAISGNDLFVATGSNDTIGEYTLGSPGVITSSMPSLISTETPYGLAISGNDLFVANYSSTVSEYTTDGGPVNTPLVLGLRFPEGIAVSGNNVIVATGNTIGEFSATTGTPVGTVAPLGSGTLVSGLNDPAFLAVETPAVPEPSTWALLLGGLGLLAFWRNRTNRSIV